MFRADPGIDELGVVMASASREVEGADAKQVSAADAFIIPEPHKLSIGLVLPGLFIAAKARFETVRESACAEPAEMLSATRAAAPPTQAHAQPGMHARQRGVN